MSEPSREPRPWAGFRRSQAHAAPRFDGFVGFHPRSREGLFSAASWKSSPGSAEHADYNAGRVIDEIEKQGKLDNTLIFYIWGETVPRPKA